MKPIMPLAAIVAIAAAPATAVTTTLDFNAAEACVAACVNGSQIRQTYGDTADLDMSYLARDDFGNATVFVSTMFWWNTGFGDLQGVAWVGQTAEYRMELLTPGRTITLDSFDMARFTGPALTDLRVYDLGWNLLWSATDQLAPIGGRLTYAPAVSSTTGLILQHGPDAGNRGIDNISVTITNTIDPPMIPEPATWAMLIAGFGLVGAAARRRFMQRVGA
jgi:hypothetical protein